MKKRKALPTWLITLPVLTALLVAAFPLGVTEVVGSLEPEVGVGSYWIYNVHYENSAKNYTDDSLVAVKLEQINMTPWRMSPCDTPPLTTPVPAVSSNLITIDYRYGGTTPLRYPLTPPGHDCYLYSEYRFASVADGTTQYCHTTGDLKLLGASFQIDFGYTDYTLLSGSNIGLPYTVGNSWSYHVSRQAYTGAPFSFCCQHVEYNQTVNVTAANETVTVPAGTFTDCFVIETRGNEYGNETALYSADWWSATVMGLVKSVDYMFEGEEIWELTSYSLASESPVVPAITSISPSQGTQDRASALPLAATISSAEPARWTLAPG